jgi:hypothetical protein
MPIMAKIFCFSWLPSCLDSTFLHFSMMVFISNRYFLFGTFWHACESPFWRKFSASLAFRSASILLLFIPRLSFVLSTPHFRGLHFLTPMRIRTLAKTFCFSRPSFCFHSTLTLFFIVFSHFNSSFPSFAWSDTHANPHFGEGLLLLSASVLLRFYFYSFLHCLLSFQLVVSECCIFWHRLEWRSWQNLVVRTLQCFSLCFSRHFVTQYQFILSKISRLIWSPGMSVLAGMVDRLCSGDIPIAIGIGIGDRSCTSWDSANRNPYVCEPSSWGMSADMHPSCDFDNRSSSRSYGIWDANEELIVAWPFASLF